MSGAGSPKMLVSLCFKVVPPDGESRVPHLHTQVLGKAGGAEADMHVGSFCNAPKSPLPSINLQPLAGNKSLKSMDIKACYYQMTCDALRVHQSLYSDFQPMT